MKKRVFLSGLTAACLASFAVQSVGFAAEKSPVILTISVPHAQKGRVQIIALSEQDLRALPAISYKTTTIWTSGAQQFTGVPVLA
nr:hypothetical protein [Roseovarius sp.]